MRKNEGRVGLQRIFNEFPSYGEYDDKPKFKTKVAIDHPDDEVRQSKTIHERIVDLAFLRPPQFRKEFGHDVPLAIPHDAMGSQVVLP